MSALVDEGPAYTHQSADHRPTLVEEAREVWRYRDLLVGMTKRELKIRYKNSILGFLWSFVQPLAMMLVFTFVFKEFFHITEPNYSAYFLAALLPFNFFSQSVMDASSAVLAAQNIIKKVYFP